METVTKTNVQFLTQCEIKKQIKVTERLLEDTKQELLIATIEGELLLVCYLQHEIKYYSEKKTRLTDYLRVRDLQQA